jgi:hypothetical protein
MTPQTHGAGDAVAVLKQAKRLAFHEHGHAERDGFILEGADQFQTRAVTDVRQPRMPVATETALVDLPFLVAVEHRPPTLELQNALGRLLRVQLGHAPVVEELSTAHGIAEVNFPRIERGHVAEGRGSSALRHDGVRLAEQRLAHHRGFEAKHLTFDRCAEAGTAGADHENIVFDGLEFADVEGTHQKLSQVLRSVM